MKNNGYKNKLRKTYLLLFLGTALISSGCGTTQSEHGVTIEKGATMNPMSWF